MRLLLAVVRYALDHRPAVLVPLLLPVLVTMLVASAAPTVPVIAAAAVALPASMVAWGGGVWAGKLHERNATSLADTTEWNEAPGQRDRPGGEALESGAERQDRAA